MKTVNEIYFPTDDLTFEVRSDGSLFISNGDFYATLNNENFSKLAAFFEESALKLGDIKNKDE